MSEILYGIISVLLGGTTSILFELIKKIKMKNSEDNLEDKVSKLTSSLHNSIEVIDQIQNEIEERKELAKKLEHDIKTYNKIVNLKESEVEAVAQLLRGELERGNKKSFWQGVIINFIFFILGAGTSFAIAYFIG